MLKTSKLSVTILLLFLASFLITCGGGGGGASYTDADGDGFTSEIDCDDADASINPDAAEIPDDKIDQDCDGWDSSIFFADADGDGFGDPDVSVIGLSRPDGYVTNNSDCDDNTAYINPDAQDMPDDGIDQDCDGFDMHTYYADADGDGYGNPNESVFAISQPEGYITDNNDCDDNDETINPDAKEVPNDFKDNDCNGYVDELCVPEHYNTIQEAIDASKNDDIVFVDDGIYIENINFNGKAITVKSINGAASTIIDGNSSGCVVTFSSEKNSSSLLDGFIIYNGSGTYNSYNNKLSEGYYGGGIYCYNSSPIITNCIIEDNTVIDDPSNDFGVGGGIYIEGGSPIIKNCIIDDNDSILGGGIVCNYSLPIIINCTISNNISTEKSKIEYFESSGGGGVLCYNHSDAIIRNCTIKDNSSDYWGGGIQCDLLSSPTITNCTIKGNSAHRGGGICYSNNYFIRFSPFRITNCTIKGNSAHRGGGIYFGGNSNTPIITNCTIVDNTAYEGGGIFNYNMYLTVITNSTVSGNTANSLGGGIYANMHLSILVNSIFWGNTANTDGNEIYLDTASATPASIDIAYSDIQGGWEGEGNINVDPLFVDDTNEDLLLRDYHLNEDSPCIGAGIDKYIVDTVHYVDIVHEENVVPVNDIDGDQRPQGAGIDIGMDEYTSP